MWRSIALLALALAQAIGGDVLSGVNTPYILPESRTIAWTGQAGLDPVGGIPSSGWTENTCAGLDTTGTTNNTSNINTCITNASSNTVVKLPAGIIRVDGDINMKSNVALRGAKAQVSPFMPTADATATTLNMSGSIIFAGGSKAANFGVTTAITAGYTQGSSSITVSAPSTFAVNDYISIFQNEDLTLIFDEDLDYLGDDDPDAATDPHVMAMYSKVTAKNGSVLTISPSIGLVSPSPTGQSIREQSFGITNAGVENMRLRGDQTNIKLIDIEFTRNVWVKGVETYNVGQSSSGSPHIWTRFSMNNEYRDGYHHHGVSNDSGRNYGIEFYNWNSGHKVENNIVRHTRHSIIFEGGGSRNAVLYNYTDDNWESVQGSGGTPDTEFLSEDLTTNHGAHPMMNLWEGNRGASFAADFTQGSSSHNTLFRNHITCTRSTVAITDPWSHNCVEIEQYNRFYNLVGNVIGLPALTTGTVTCNSGTCNGNLPFVFRFGYSSYGGSYQDTQSASTVIRHGNFDYVGDSIAHWDGGTNHTLANSLYYTDKPSWYGGCVWPPVVPTVPTTNDIPAKKRYDGTTC